MIGIRKMRDSSLCISSFFWKMYIYFKARILWNIVLGKHCIFNGNIILYRIRESKIMIGNNCRFISNANSYNLIGINRPCIIGTHTSKATIQIGDGCGFSGTVIGAFKQITIGENVMCGANTLITDSDWHLEDPRSGIPKEVIIGNNVWLGINAVILKGVTIGENTVIGANSVVTKSIPKNVIAAGNPCKVIKNLYKS